ncbi:MAG: Gfo/Idh/MocA family oxidoreductase [Anaerolineae bacterium]|nr:Gfo/Idh/MocA family oxidoreductase [Anaerolineae bacterium]
MAATMRVGVAGAGFIGVVHARAYKQVPGVELVGVADPLKDKAQAIAGEVGCEPFSHYEDLLENGKLDLISVCLPPALHLPAAQAAAQAGVHILMEKPITRTVAEADRLLAICREGGVYLMTGFTHHFYPEMREAKRIVDSGALGTPLTVLDSMSISHSLVLPWYRDREIAGGGVFMCNAVHGFDRVSWVLNQRITAVSALVQPTEGAQGEDYGSALARFDGGTQGTFFQHWGPYRTLMCELQIYGEEGMLHARSWDSLELLIGDNRTVHRFYYPDHGLAERVMIGMVAELTEFVEAVRAGRQPQPSGEEGRTSVALVLATYRSAQTGTWVELPAP